MSQAASTLRRTALSLRRLMAHPHAAQALAALDQPGRPRQDHTHLAARLADQAVDPVTALDYLLTLLSDPGIPPLPLTLEKHFGHDLADEQAQDQLARLAARRPRHRRTPRQPAASSPCREPAPHSRPTTTPTTRQR
jgi:hypothetical protein